MKLLSETLADISNRVTKTKSGKVKKTFNLADEAQLTNSLINDTDYTYEIVKNRNGELVTESVNPAKLVREKIKNVLVDFGVDKQEAENVMSGEKYQMKLDNSLYYFYPHVITLYTDAGKKFNFPQTRDCNASITMQHVGKTTKEYRSIKKGDDSSPAEKFLVEIDDHRIIKTSSKAPKWLKTKKKSK